MTGQRQAFAERTVRKMQARVQRQARGAKQNRMKGERKGCASFPPHAAGVKSDMADYDDSTTQNVDMRHRHRGRKARISIAEKGLAHLQGCILLSEIVLRKGVIPAQ